MAIQGKRVRRGTLGKQEFVEEGGKKVRGGKEESQGWMLRVPLARMGFQSLDVAGTRRGWLSQGFSFLHSKLFVLIHQLNKLLSSHLRVGLF